MTQSDPLARYALKRDAEAFAQIVAQYQGLVFATCRRVLRDQSDVDDAVQETFLRLAKKASGLRSNLGGWLYTCAANVAADMNRRGRSRSHHESAVVARPASENDSQRTLAELREHLDAAMQKLNAGDRELIIQRFFIGRQQIDLAEEAGVAASTISHRLERAVDALRGHLKDLGCGIAIAGTLATLLEAERVSAAVPSSLTASIMKIGLTGVSGGALGGALSVPVVMLTLLGLAAAIAIGIWHFTSSSAVHAGQPSPASQAALLTSGLHGRVLGPDGKPVAGAIVFVALPQPSGIRIRNGRLESDDPAIPRAVTDADGQYDLPAQSGPFMLQVIADAGYRQADPQTLAQNADIQLAAWGQIQGRLMLGTKPGAGIALQASSIDPARSNGPQLSMVNRATTDANGNFTMDHVVPGVIDVERSFEQQSGSHSMIFFGDVGSAEVTAGQTTTVTFGGVGRPVTGKFIFPPGMNPSDYFINARAFSAGNAAANPRDYFLDVDPQQHFQISNVVPGDYKIHVFLQKPGGDRTEQSEMIKFTMPAIPAGVSDEPLVIPDIQLK